MRTLLLLLAFPAVLFSQSTDEEPSIEDNSFLIEEAYNQEYGVVQHIQTFARDFTTKDYVYAFSQEWPVDLDPRHQFSYTLLAAHSDDVPKSGPGFGDMFLNYRFQLVRNERLAVAPRASFIVPTGDSTRGRGLGAPGFQTNWALSFRALPKLTMHSNAGWTIVPNAKNSSNQQATVNAFNLGQSFIWLAKPRFNVLFETVYAAIDEVVLPDKTQRAHDLIMNPGVRWAYNFKNGMQIVPGVSIPTGVGPSAGNVGLLFYLSIEHPFRKQKN
jgi:hypothetical protein